MIRWSWNRLGLEPTSVLGADILRATDAVYMAAAPFVVLDLALNDKNGLSITGIIIIFGFVGMAINYKRHTQQAQKLHLDREFRAVVDE